MQRHYCIDQDCTDSSSSDAKQYAIGTEPPTPKAEHSQSRQIYTLIKLPLIDLLYTKGLG